MRTKSLRKLKLGSYFTPKVLQNLAKQGKLRCPGCGEKVDFQTIPELRDDLDEQSIAELLESLEYNNPHDPRARRSNEEQCLHAQRDGWLLSFPGSIAERIGDEWTRLGALLEAGQGAGLLAPDVEKIDLNNLDEDDL